MDAHSLKGLYGNIRKLTEDLLSDDAGSIAAEGSLNYHNGSSIINDNNSSFYAAARFAKKTRMNSKISC
jgi:large exoprotein involved in heme utilization and adhesion